MIVWLDLEETIINNWNDGLLINTQRISKWLNDRNINEINIWSFAIYNQSDQYEFIDSGMKKAIECALSCTINEFPSIIEMQQLIFEYENIKYDSPYEFIQINGKRWSFVKYCLGHQINNHCVLIDDAVPNIDICDRTNNSRIELYNIVDI